MAVGTASLAAAREDVRAWLRASGGQALGVWLRMPAKWTPATKVAKGMTQSSLSTALGILRQAGAVETKRRGQVVYYRPMESFQIYAKAIRRPLKVPHV